MTIFSIGHSTHGIAEFLELLTRQGIRLLADVRRFPGSRRHPHFSKENLESSLNGQDIGYEHFADLGGRREPLADSPNRGWKVAAFQGYADHLGTATFKAALAALEKQAIGRTTAYMCAEAPWWKCHRRVLSDALVVQGWTVRHIMPGGECEDHRLPEFAFVEAGRLTYPPNQSGLLF